MGHITEQDREQVTLFPETIEEYISDNNPVRIIDVFVNNLDLVAAGFKNTAPAAEGRPSYSPKTLLKLYIYGYFNKIRSSRKLMMECGRNIEMMWLLGKLVPDFRTIADFRKNNAKALKNVFRAFVKICMELNLYTKELTAIDGSKFRAVNSKKNNTTISRVEDRLKRIEENIKNFLDELDKYDKNDDISKDPTRDDLNEKLEKLRTKKDIYNGYLKEMKECNQSQMSFVDSESRLMKTSNGGFDVCYNIQTAVDAGSHLIVDFDVTNNCNDNCLLYEDARRVKEIMKVDVLDVVADNGYYNPDDIGKCLKEGIVPNVALKDGVSEVEILLPYVDSEITPEMLESRKPEDISRCLEAGVLPSIYKDVDIDLEVVEVARDVPSKKCFVLNEDGKSVTCPQGQILRKKAYLKKIHKTSYANCSACHHCDNKCTTFKHKLVNFKEGQKILYLRIPNYKERKVRIRLRPDKEKIKTRKCVVEHPYGTIKRWCDGSYLLLKGKTKAAADISLSFLAYNMKRVINMVGAKELIEQMV